MLQSLTPRRRRVVRSWRRKAPACAEVRKSGSVTISSSGRAAAVEVDAGALGPGAAPVGAAVDELRGVLLEVGAGDAHRRTPPPASAPRRARRRRWARRTGRSGTPSRGPDRSSSCGGTASAGRSRSPSASPARIARWMASRFITGSTPGWARQTGQVWVLGGSPKLSSQPQNIFVRVESWTWISSPITGSQAVAVLMPPPAGGSRSRWRPPARARRRAAGSR